MDAHPFSTGSPFSMAGSVVVVLGAGPGIGVGCAGVLGAAGAHVACVDVDLAVAEQTASTLKQAGGQASALAVDVTDRSGVRAVLREVANAHGRIDGVLNVVGRAHIAGSLEVRDDDWANQLDINLTHHFVVAQESLPHLAETRGGYVAVASVNGLGASPQMLAYGVAKAGILSMMRTLSLEHGPIGVRFNAIAPGLVSTPHAQEIGFTTGELGDRFRNAIPMRDFATPQDIGGAAYFLLSPLGRHVSGQVIVVDGAGTNTYYLPEIPV